MTAHKKKAIALDGGPLSLEAVELVARHEAIVTLTERAAELIDYSQRSLQAAMQRAEPIYGVNTGFGALGRIRIEQTQLRKLQLNLIRSHSTGVGPDLATDIIRGTMLVLAACLSRGHSGVRRGVVDTIVQLLNAHVTPCVPETGSVGASGDLAPLAHIALVLVGEGQANSKGTKVPGQVALQQARIAPLVLEAKEGIALINGTHLMASQAALLIADFQRLWDAAVVAAAMSVDACRATDSTLDRRVHDLRQQPGQQLVAERLRYYLAGSEIIRSHQENDPRVQDPYSFRCSPAVLGAAWDSFQYAKRTVIAELAAVTDNPLVFSHDGRPEVVSGGNFHGLPLALPLDCLTIAIAHVAGIAERRVYHMLSGADPEAELPTFLTPQAGLQCGLMITQYTAAACCNEIVGLTLPASVVNLPTSAGMEDYNSFGPRSAAKAVRAMQLARSVIAIEFICASEGLDHHRPLRSGNVVESAYQAIRQVVPPLTEDRSPAPDIRAVERLIDRGAFTV